MITRANYKPVEKRDTSKDDEFSNYSYEKKIIVLSTNKDGSVDKFVEKNFWKEEKSSWSKYVESFNLGSVQEQVMDHLTKGTPLVTAHTLPAADYTKLEKGAEIKREMSEKGISLEMLVQAFNDAMNNKSVEKVVTEGEFK